MTDYQSLDDQSNSDHLLVDKNLITPYVNKIFKLIGSLIIEMINVD